MSFLNELRNAIKIGQCPPIFKPSDLREAGINDDHSNLSNYDKKNGETNNEKALVSRRIAGDTYYTLDEQVLEKRSPGNPLKCDEKEDGTRIYYSA